MIVDTLGGTNFGTIDWSPLDETVSLTDFRGDNDLTFLFGDGNDNEDRAKLIRIGADRGSMALGVPLKACRVVVVGDTPKDVLAAQAMGAESLAVATGPFTVDDLTTAGATYAATNLDQPGAIDFLLTGNR